MKDLRAKDRMFHSFHHPSNPSHLTHTQPYPTLMHTSNNTLQFGYVTVSRTCPLGKCTIKHPVRGPHCAHFQAFERDVWMASFVNKKKQIQKDLSSAQVFCERHNRANGECVPKESARACRKILQEFAKSKDYLVQLIASLSHTCPVCEAPVPFLVDAVEFEMAMTKTPNAHRPNELLVPQEWFAHMEKSFSFSSFYHCDMPDWGVTTYLSPKCKENHPFQPLPEKDFQRARLLLGEIYQLAFEATDRIMAEPSMENLIRILNETHTRLLTCPIPTCLEKHFEICPPHSQEDDDSYDHPFNARPATILPDREISDLFRSQTTFSHSFKRHGMRSALPSSSSSSSSSDQGASAAIIEFGPLFFLSIMDQTYDSQLDIWFNSTRKALPPVIDVDDYNPKNTQTSQQTTTVKREREEEEDPTSESFDSPEPSPKRRA